MEYWDYYNHDFDWDDVHERLRPDYNATHARFKAIGLSDAESETFIKSGYVLLQDDIIVDRFYGGRSLRIDNRTRFSLDHFLDAIGAGSSRTPIVEAQSMGDVLGQIEKWQSANRHQLLFRGQTKNYPLSRERPNPWFQLDGIGEISLLPTIWRAMQKKRPNSFAGFNGLSVFDWSLVIYDQFNMAEIERRDLELSKERGWPYSAQDMEDSEDPLLHEFGRTRLDLMMEYSYNQADALNTLLQHYGLHSPLLDLSSNIDVALFFSSHTMEKDGDRIRCNFVGNNGAQSVIYVFRQDMNEMYIHEHARVLNELKPLRPIRQSCVVCHSSPYALNLAADFLVGIIKMNFVHDEKLKFAVSELFPPEEEDYFLRAMKRKLLHPEYITDFV